MVIIKDYPIQIVRVFDYNFEKEKSKIVKNSICCICISWYCTENILAIINSGVSDNYVIMTNTVEEINFYEEYLSTNNTTDCNIYVIFCNHNAFINIDIYTIHKQKTNSRPFDLIINSCFSKYKNVHIAEKLATIDNMKIGHIGYYNGNEKLIPTYGELLNFKGSYTLTHNREKYKKPNTQYIFISKFIHNKPENLKPENLKPENLKLENSENLPQEIKKYHKLSQYKVTQYLNQSKLGGIFSELEGACFSSSEYLLCGLPVISTKSLGGRDIWYTPDNSIICDLTYESISNSVKLALEKLANGSFNREKIRQSHIAMSEIHLDRLCDLIDKIINDNKSIIKPFIINRNLFKRQICNRI